MFTFISISFSFSFHLNLIILGKAVGVRNFPDKGMEGEEFLRDCFDLQLEKLGGYFLPEGAVCVDMGCGTGILYRFFSFF